MSDGFRERARQIAEDPYTRTVLYLVSKGIPFDIAFSLDWHEVVGWVVAIGETESGKKFNWSKMEWPE